MATDIVDKDLKKLRNDRWNRAFSTIKTSENFKQQSGQSEINRKATIVIEHLIQASDVAHTMQHWHIYRRWNDKFFQECYLAYKDGRAENNPADSWYQGELGFFDFYIIPLAKKLKECGVFGVSGDEYLNYALENRKEWEARGETIVKEMVKAAHQHEVGKRILSVSLHDDEIAVATADKVALRRFSSRNIRETSKVQRPMEQKGMD
jgi:3'5'-cyclic nucleotide phosphodiesterase